MNYRIDQRLDVGAWWLGIGTLVLCFAASVFGQEDQPTLDELLDLNPLPDVSPEASPELPPGLPEEGSPEGPVGAPSDPPTGEPRDERTDLLDDAAAEPDPDLFRQAVKEMRVVSQRMGDGGDPGLGTQRLQRSILDKLDQLIAAAGQRDSPSGGGGGSGASGSSQPMQQDTGSAANAGQGQSAGGSQAGSGQAGGAAPSSGGAAAGAVADQALGPMQENRAEWGNLPPRLRDELQEGFSEPFSPIYQSLTERYYRSLAESQDGAVEGP